MPMHGEAFLEWDLLGTWWRPGPLLPHLRRNRALVHRMELGVGDAYPRGRGVHVWRGDVCGQKRRKAMARCHEGHATQSQSTDQQPQQYRREDPVSELGHARGTIRWEQGGGHRAHPYARRTSIRSRRASRTAGSPPVGRSWSHCHRSSGHPRFANRGCGCGGCRCSKGLQVCIMRCICM